MLGTYNTAAWRTPHLLCLLCYEPINNDTRTYKETDTRAMVGAIFDTSLTQIVTVIVSWCTARQRVHSRLYCCLHILQQNYHYQYYQTAEACPKSRRLSQNTTRARGFGCGRGQRLLHYKYNTAHAAKMSKIERDVKRPTRATRNYSYNTSEERLSPEVVRYTTRVL